MEIEIGSVILEGFKTIKDIPGVLEKYQRLYDRLKGNVVSGNTVITASPLIGRVVKGESDKLLSLIKKFYAIDSDDKYHDIEKDAYRKKIAAQICAILTAIDPIKDQIPDYDNLVELFCNSFPSLFATA